MRKYEKASKGEMASAMKKIIEYMKGSVGIVAVALVLAALGAVLTIIGPDKVGEITDLMADGLMTGIDLKAVARVGIFLGAIYISSSLFTFIQQYIMATVTLKMSYRMRSDLSRKINCVPQKYFNSHSQGDILSRINFTTGSYKQSSDHNQCGGTVCGLSYNDVRYRMATCTHLTVHHILRTFPDSFHNVKITEVLPRQTGKPW